MEKWVTKKEIGIFILFFLIYMLFIQWNGWNENSRLALTRSIVDENRLEIDSFANQTGDRSFFQGHYYSDKDPGTSLIAAIPYSIFKFFYHSNDSKENQLFFSNSLGNVKIYDILNPDSFTLYSMIIVTVFTSAFLSSLTLVLIYKISGFFAEKKSNRLVITLAAGFSTTIFPYATVFMENATATFFALLGFYLLLKMKRQKVNDNKYSFFAGVSFSLAVLANVITGFIFVLCLGYLLSFRKKYLGIFFLGFLAASSIYLAYNSLAFGTPFTLSRNYLDPQVWGKITGFNGLDIPNPYVIWRLLFDPFKGIFFYYPILIFSIFGLWLMRKKMRVEAFLILLIFASLLIFNSSWWIWWGGASFAARHLTYAVPFLLLPSIFVLNKNNKSLNMLFLILLVFSAFVNFASLQPRSDEIAGPDRITIADQYKSKINTFEIFANPIFDNYVPQFFVNGPRSRLIDCILENKTPDIRFLLPEDRDQFPYFHSTLHLFKVQQNINDFILTKNWYKKSLNEIPFWMKNDGVIVFVNNEMPSNRTLNFLISSYLQDRNLTVSLNGEQVLSTSIKAETVLRYQVPISIKYGLNQLQFKASPDCEIPNLVQKAEDKRCLSIALFNISKSYYYISGFYPQSKNEELVWMGQNGKIIFYNDGPETKKRIYFDLVPFYDKTTLNLNLNGIRINTFTIVKDGGIIFTLPQSLNHGENLLELFANEKCTRVSEILNNTDDRCLTFGFRNVYLGS